MPFSWWVFSNVKHTLLTNYHFIPNSTKSSHLLCVIITYITARTKKLFNAFWIRKFLFLSLLIWNWNDKYVHTLCSSLENHTLFQTKMGKVYIRFQTKTAQKPYPMGRHIPIWLIKGSSSLSPPRVPPGLDNYSFPRRQTQLPFCSKP